MGRLTEEQAVREAGLAGTKATSLNLTHRALSDVSCLSSFKNLERLDLSYNCLVTLEGLSSCANLKWLSVIENKLVSLKGVEELSKLQVLNAGKNKLTKMDEVASLTSLGALILNDNNISSICKLDRLQQLNTRAPFPLEEIMMYNAVHDFVITTLEICTEILSKNPVFTIGSALLKAKSMKKLSFSHCQIENIGSSLAECVELKELRLSHNKISTIPSDLAKNLKILNLDLGNNFIERSSDLKVLSELRYLRNLNLQGNPVSEKDSLVKKVKKFVPTLRILNAKPLEGTSKNDKSSRKENPPSKDKDPIGIDTKKDKRKKSKQELKDLEQLEVQSISTGVTTVKHGKLEVPDSKERKKVKKEVKTKKSEELDHANNSTLENKAVQSSAYDTSTKDKKETKRKKFVDEEDVDAEGIDNTEISFADLMFSNVGHPETKLKDSSTQEAAPDGKFVGDLVIDHTKKRKKSKGVVTINDSSALKMFSSMPEVGTGGLGLSGWDE